MSSAAQRDVGLHRWQQQGDTLSRQFIPNWLTRVSAQLPGFQIFQGIHVLTLDKLQAGTNQQARLWSALWLDASRLFWSSSDVVARRGLLFAQSGPAALFDADFDSMSSEKHRAAVDAWMAMSMKAAQFMPGWSLRLWLNALQPATTPQAAQKRIEASGLRAADEALQITQAGMRPVQRQVTKNAKRLAKKKSGRGKRA